ncbi:hypothetical protein [Streptomyces sp. ST2-7A]|uniref:hypothetical protein n=1 Tax=Streptomyces sp. ST2-7A TaxID=2907214 RepID=UPI001F250566|nr:hypothetical protein [Streptomyces sp. ST2-7A]MCE7080496.1 hypothetical protein [Streptomyces sp. ST2-7A]
MILNPENNQVVNLPSRVWLDENTFEPVTVRAELPDYGIWAETVATPPHPAPDTGHPRRGAPPRLRPMRGPGRADRGALDPGQNRP